jgi:DNA-binding CsgD family transcriptional regulator
MRAVDCLNRPIRREHDMAGVALDDPARTLDMHSQPDGARTVRRGDPDRATTCIRTVGGHWLRVEATAHPLGGADVAVIMQAATPHQLVRAFADGHRLTPREVDVLDQLLRGQSGKRAARQLELSVLTVNGHLQSIYRKCSVRGRDELLAQLA